MRVDIMECLVVTESVFNVEARKSIKLLAYVTNQLFGQKKVAPKEPTEQDKDDLDSERSPLLKKPRKEIGNLEYVLPTRTAIRKMG